MEHQFKVRDEWGGELDAICTLVDPEKAIWKVLLSSHRGVRGSITVTAPGGVKALEKAVADALVEEGIHATNNPGR